MTTNEMITSIDSLTNAASKTPVLLNNRFLEVLACPECHGDLSQATDTLNCSQCNSSFAIKEGIPILEVRIN